MKIHCPSCSKEYNIDEKYFGKQVKCTNCETLFRIPRDIEGIHKMQSVSKDDHISETAGETQPVQDRVEVSDDTELKTQGITNVKPKNKQIIQNNPSLESIHLKPKYPSFLLFSYPAVYFLGIASIVSLIISIFFPVFISIFAIAFILTGVGLFLVSIIYKKEQYHLEQDHISFDFGGIFSDNSMELKYNKITQVTLHQRFLERYLFHTGTIQIGNAGSSQSVIMIKNIPDSKKYYEEIQVRMRANGYSLKKENLVQTEKPHWLGVLGELAIGIIIVFYVDIILLPIIAVHFILRYLDLMNRVYDIYDDCIVYNEGFLDHRFSIIPMEAISDAKNQQSFFARIFGLHNIIISSEGSKNKVNFNNMVNGEKIAKNILYLKKNYYFRADNDTLSQADEKKEQIFHELDYDTEFTTEYRPNILRSIIGFTLKNIFTKYKVEENSVHSRFDFFTTQTKTFTTDKVSKIIFHENIIDRLFGTCSIEFDSLGSSSALIFRYLNKKDVSYEKLLAKVGIYETDEKHSISPNFTLSDYLKSHTYLLVLVFPIVWLLLIYPYYLFFYSKRFYSIYTTKTYIQKTSGIILKRTEYATYNNIKNIFTRQSPLTSNGEIHLIVGGDSGSQSSYTSTRRIGSLQFTNSIKLAYLNNCFILADTLESQIAKRKLNQDILKEYKEDFGNSILLPVLFLLFPVIILTILVSPLFSTLLIIPFVIIGIIVLYIKSVRYKIMGEKVVKTYGIIFHSKKSILFQRINLLEKNQGFVGKIFSNGSVKIFSKGSSQAELSLLNIKDYELLYQELNKHTN